MKTFVRFLMVLAVTICWVHPLGAQPGTVDPTFDPGSTTDGAVLAIVPLSDGKAMVAGDFQVMHSLLRGGVARLNPDGSLDMSFGAGLDGANNQVAAVAVQPDGRVLIAGKFSTVNGVTRNRVARLNADGSLDTSFAEGLAGTDGRIEAVAVQADGKVLIGGVFSTVNGVLRNNLARLHPDGSLDAGFDVRFNRTDPGVEAIVVLDDGRLLVSGGFRVISGIARNKLARLHPDGSVDTEFTPDVVGQSKDVLALATQDDGKVIIGGYFSTVGGQSRGNVARLNFNGTLDTNFMAGLGGANNWVTSVAVQADGKVLVAGYFTTMHDVTRRYIARLNVDGTLDTGFDAGTVGATVQAVSAQSDGSVLIGGAFVRVNNVERRHIARLGSGGSLDTTFGSGPAGINAPVRTLALQPDGRVFVGGTFSAVNETARGQVARLNTNGTLDTTFGASLAGSTGPVEALALQPDGKLLVAGKFDHFNGSERGSIARVHENGALDTGFSGDVGDGRTVHAMVLQPDGAVLLAGDFTYVNEIIRHRIARLNANGTLDTGFGYGPGIRAVLESQAKVFCMTLEPGGKPLIGGPFDLVHGTNRPFVARLTTNGSLDTTFGSSSSGPNSWVRCFVTQPDGRILIGGQFKEVHGFDRTFIARLQSNGGVDESFKADLIGIPGYAGWVDTIAVQPDGKLVIGGSFTNVNGVSRNNIARLNPDGSLDAAFGAGLSGANSNVLTVALQPDGAILVGGEFTVINNTARRHVARLYATSIAPVITSQPQSRTNTAGTTATFSVTATGRPAPDYQWLKNETALADGGTVSGATTATLTLDNVQAIDTAHYSVVVSNEAGSVTSTPVTLRVNHPPLADASASPALVISPDNTNGTVILDGSRSSDADTDPLMYLWYLSNPATPLATGIVAVVVLPIGVHLVALRVDDGLVTATDTITIRVVTTAQAVDELVEAVRTDVERSNPLVATLNASIASIDRTHPATAINQLQAFQNQVRAQVAPLDPALAEALIQNAQAVIDTLSAPDAAVAASKSAAKLDRIEQRPNGKVRLQFSAAPGRPHLVEASTNLVHWELIGVAVDLGDGTFEFETPAGDNSPARYFRVVMP